jgi:EmrB/QacA subfamily drug resistance transporter
MFDQTTGRSWPIRALSTLLGGLEPAPAGFIVRQPFYPWLIVATTCIGAVLGQLDASIVQLALPTFEREFMARLSAVTWVALGYQLAFAAILPVYARLAEVAGRKLMYLAGFALFALASALCGLAANLTVLIALRVLLGLSGAMLGANSVVILVKAAGPARRGRAMGIFAAAQAIGISLGPVTGGFVLAELGWRWLFWINVPLGIAGAVIGWLVVPRTTDLSSDRRFDGLGALLLVPALTALLLLISKSFAWGPTSAAILGSAIAAIALLAAFIRHERRTAAPLLDLDLFRIPAFAGGVIAIAVSYGMLFGMFFLMSFALVRGFHDSPMAAGLRLAIVPVALGIVAPFSGALHERLGARTVLVSGMLVCLAALVVLSVTLTGTPPSLLGVMAALGVYGAGLGIFIAPNNSLTLRAAPASHSGQAGGLLNLMRIFGTSLGVACASAVLSWRLDALAGTGDNTMGAPDQALLQAVGNGLLVLIAFAAVATVASLLRGPPRAAAVQAA